MYLIAVIQDNAYKILSFWYMNIVQSDLEVCSGSFSGLQGANIFATNPVISSRKMLIFRKVVTDLAFYCFAFTVIDDPGIFYFQLSILNSKLTGFFAG